MRKRNHTVCIRMSDEEYEMLQQKVSQSGQTIQAFMTNAIDNVTIASAEMVAEMDAINKQFEETNKQLRGLGTNVNQMAHIANGQGFVPSAEELVRVGVEVDMFRRECESEWRLLRQLRSRQKVTVD